MNNDNVYKITYFIVDILLKIYTRPIEDDARTHIKDLYL